MSLMIGIDAHSQVHVAAAVDAHGRPMAECERRRLRPSNSPSLIELDRRASPAPQVAVEGSKGYGRTLTQQLLAAGEPS